MTDLTAHQLTAISRLFSSSVIREMARRGKSPLFARLATESCLLTLHSPQDHVFAVFDSAFSLLKQRGNRDEYVYKAALVEKVLLGKHSLHTASMLTEFRAGECKADLAILNGTSTVYEIKSERDSLSRLERQVAAYSSIFARVYVIAAENHATSVINSVGKHVGVLCLSKRYQISTLREATDQSQHTSPAAIFDSLRTSEALTVLESYGIALPSVPNTELRSAAQNLFVRLSPRKAHSGMVRVLKQTRNLLPLSTLVAQLPSSLQTAALTVHLRKLDHARLVAAVNTRLEDALAWA